MPTPFSLFYCNRSRSRRRAEAFTLIELLMVIAIIGMLIALLLPALGMAKESGRSITFAVNLRQLGMSLSMYADENQGSYTPPRTSTNRWTSRLLNNYQLLSLLLCPSDGPNPATAGTDPVNLPADSAPRSYIINGWNDFFGTDTYTGAMREQDVLYPSATILFGEKVTTSPQYYMDLFEGPLGNDVTELEQSRHLGSGPGSRAGASNYVFADIHTLSIGFGGSVSPVNEWAVSDVWRNTAVTYESVPLVCCTQQPSDAMCKSFLASLSPSGRLAVATGASLWIGDV